MRLDEIPIDKIDPNVGNVRRELGSVTELAASIKARGILEPLVVAASDHGDRYTLIAGHRRHAAALKAKLTKVPCRVLDAMTRAEELELMLVENLQRSDLTPVEEAQAYQQLLLEGVDVDGIRKATGRSPATIRSRLKILDLPAAAVERVHKGQMSLDAALKLAQFADEPAQVDRLANLLDGPYSSNFSYYLKSATERSKGMSAARSTGAEVYTDLEALKAAHPHLERQPYGTKPGPGTVVHYGLTTGRDPDGVYQVLQSAPTDDDASADELAAKRQENYDRERKSREEARQRRHLAQEIRLDFVREQLPQKKLRPAAVLNGLRSAAAGLAPHSELLALLGIETNDRYIGTGEVEAKTRPVTDQMELANLVVLLTAAILSSAAGRALNETQDNWTKAHHLQAGVAWFDYLVSLGYELNDIDTAKLAEIEARIQGEAEDA